MKRAVFILIAALLVLLIYPSTQPYAASPKYGTQEGPTVITPYYPDTPPIGTIDSDDDGGGDADDVTGTKGSKTNPTGCSINNVVPKRIGLFFKMWWNLLFRMR